MSDPLVVDLTSIAPGASGGVSLVASGVISGLSELGSPPRCLVTPGTTDAWLGEFTVDDVIVDELKVPMRATSGWQTALRKVLPDSLKRSWVVGLVRSARSSAVVNASGDSTTWFPFHRSIARARSSVVTVHDLRVFESDFASPMDQQIIRTNVTSAKALVCSWAHPYEHLKALFPEAAAKIFLVPLPVLNQGPPTDRQAPGDRVRLLYPAHVTPHKNHEIIIRAMVERPTLTLTCTGSEVPAHASYLRRLADELGVASRITWRGFISAEELELEYQNAHILAMPTRWEAASGPLFEAIVRELPFVASTISPLQAQLRSLDLDAPSFDWDSPSQFVAAVDSVIADYQGFRERLIEPAKIVRSRTWRDTAADYSDVFNWAAGSGAAPVHLQPRREANPS